MRSPAVQALWSFHRETVLFRNRPDVADMASKVHVALTVPLPDADWRFCPDPEENGEQKAWFEPAFDDRAWKPIPIGDFWQKAGINYEGVAWYRRTFTLPSGPAECSTTRVSRPCARERAYSRCSPGTRGRKSGWLICPP